MKAIDVVLFQIAYPILMLIGTVGSVINIIVFTRKKMLRNPCSIYFIGYNFANLIYIYSALLSLTLEVGYRIDPSAKYLVICRLRLYTVILVNVLSPFYLVLASIDRILVTSLDAATRQRSTHRFAYLLLLLGTLFWALFHSHALIFADIIEMNSNNVICYFSPGIYFTCISYYSITKELLATLSMVILVIWFVKNIRRSNRVRTAINPHPNHNPTSIDNRNYSVASKDRQLLLILLMDIIIYALFSFFFAIFSMYQQSTQNQSKSFEQIQFDLFLRNIALFAIGIPFCVSFYKNLLVSKTFRQQVKNMFSFQ